MNSNVVRKVFDYDGVNVTFASKDNLVMVNATEMAKKFGKQPSDWTKTKASKSYIEALMTARKIFRPSDLLKVTNGDKGSTWMQEDVALEFARWLSPAFAIWCNDRIKELLKFGITATETTIENIIADPDNGIRLLTALKEEREKRKQLEMANQQQQLMIQQQTQQITKQKPKVAFADAVLSSPDSILIGELAKILCQRGYQTGEIRLFEKLRKDGYLCSVGSDRNLPMQRYIEMGLFEVTKGTRSGSGGVMHLTRTTKVTPKGQQYFINKFLADINIQLQ